MAGKTLKPSPRLDSTIRAVERAFDASVLIYATGTRAPQNLFGAQVANDVLPILGEHLDSIGKAERLAVVLHTVGGKLDAPWPIVNLMRAHCRELFVLVPEIALSAGTLIALGAHKVFMHPHAFLSPVDPTGSWTAEGKTQSVEIENVLGYVDFVSDRVGIRDQAALVEALKELTREVKAPMLGAVHRTRSLIERLSRNMLELHLTSISDRSRVDKIVDMLTHSLFTHQHMIPVDEAQNAIGLGDMVEEAVGRRARAMREARGYINGTLQLREPFDPESLLAEELNKPSPKRKKPLKKEPPGATPTAPTQACTIAANRAILHSFSARHSFRSTYEISKGANDQIQVKKIGVDAWTREE